LLIIFLAVCVILSWKILAKILTQAADTQNTHKNHPIINNKSSRAVIPIMGAVISRTAQIIGKGSLSTPLKPKTRQIAMLNTISNIAGIIIGIFAFALCLRNANKSGAAAKYCKGSSENVCGAATIEVAPNMFTDKNRKIVIIIAIANIIPPQNSRKYKRLPFFMPIYIEDNIITDIVANMGVLGKNSDFIVEHAAKT
jgi:hypothetical protein